MVHLSAGRYYWLATVFNRGCEELNLNFRFLSDGTVHWEDDAVDAEVSLSGLKVRLFFLYCTRAYDRVFWALELDDLIKKGEWEQWEDVTFSLTNHPNVLIPETVFEALGNIATFLEDSFRDMQEAEILDASDPVRSFETLVSGTPISAALLETLQQELIKPTRRAVWDIIGNDKVEIVTGGGIDPGDFVGKIILGRIQENLFATATLLKAKMHCWVDRDGHNRELSTAHHAKSINRILMESAIEALRGAFRVAEQLIPPTEVQHRRAVRRIERRLEATKSGLSEVGTEVRDFSFLNIEELVQMIKALKVPMLRQIKEPLANLAAAVGFGIAKVELRFDSGVVDSLISTWLAEHDCSEIAELPMAEFQAALPRYLKIPGSGNFADTGDDAQSANWLLEHLLIARDEILPRSGELGDFIIASCRSANQVIFMQRAHFSLGFKIRTIPLLEDKLDEEVVRDILHCVDTVMIASSDLKRKYGLFMGWYLELLYYRWAREEGKTVLVGGDVYGDINRAPGEFLNRLPSQTGGNALECINMLELIGADPKKPMRATLQGDTLAFCGLTKLTSRLSFMPPVPKGYRAEHREIPDWLKQLAEASEPIYLGLFEDVGMNAAYGKLLEVPKSVAISGRPNAKMGAGTGSDKSEMPLRDGRAIGQNQTESAFGVPLKAIGGGTAFDQLPDVIDQIKAGLEQSCPFAIGLRNLLEHNLRRTQIDRFAGLADRQSIREEALSRLSEEIVSLENAYRALTGSEPPALHPEVIATERRLRTLTAEFQDDDWMGNISKVLELKLLTAINLAAHRTGG